jgi:hypothetical protein
MRGLARELTKGGRFVVASIDYRWFAKSDGDAKNNTMANLIEDVYGAVAHIMEHAARIWRRPNEDRPEPETAPAAIFPHLRRWPPT